MKVFTYRNSVGNLESYCSEASDAIEGGQPVSGQGDALQENIEDTNEHNGSDGRHEGRVNLTGRTDDIIEVEKHVCMYVCTYEYMCNACSIFILYVCKCICVRRIVCTAHELH